MSTTCWSGGSTAPPRLRSFAWLSTLPWSRPMPPAHSSTGPPCRSSPRSRRCASILAQSLTWSLRQAARGGGPIGGRDRARGGPDHRPLIHDEQHRSYASASLPLKLLAAAALLRVVSQLAYPCHVWHRDVRSWRCASRPRPCCCSVPACCWSASPYQPQTDLSPCRPYGWRSPPSCFSGRLTTCTATGALGFAT